MTREVIAGRLGDSVGSRTAPQSAAMDTPQTTTARADAAAARSHYRICPVCEACCGLEVRTEGGRVVAIRGAANDVFSAGYVCPKGVALKDLHEDPDRIRTPLIRRGDAFEPASWDEAWAHIAERLPALMQAHGRDAVALVVGNPSAHKIGLLRYFGPLAKAIGTKNVFSASTLDQMPKQLSNGLMYGHWLTMAVPDIDRCQHLLVIGANPAASNGSLWTVPDFRGRAKALRERGGKLVVIDPRRTETAAMADEHHFVRPGSDVFLVAALVHTLFDEGLVNPGAAAPHLAGIDAVQAAVRPFAPEAVAARCGIDAPTLRRLAREFAAAPTACVHARLGTCTQRHGTLVSWLVDVLNALTGRLDVPGGAMFPKAGAFAANTLGAPGKGRGIGTGRHRSRVSGAPEVFGELPITCLAEEIETPGDGQVRALITIAGNPALSAPGGPRLARALDTLEFMVSVDIYLNETTRHADVILPGLSPLEESHYDVAFPQFSVRNHARYSPAVFQPTQPPEWQTLLKLAGIARGLGAHCDPLVLDDQLLADELKKLAGDRAEAVMALLSRDGRRGPERQLDLALRIGPYGDGFGARPGGLTLDRVIAASTVEQGGIDLGELQPRLPEVLRTPGGQVDLAPSPLLAALPEALAELQQPAPPLVVIGRRDVRSNNSWMHNLPLLAKGPFRGAALVHPQDAAARGLVDGATALLTGPRGEAIRVQLELSDSVMPGVVCLPHGWGHDLPGTRMSVAAERPGANLNAVLDETVRDPLSGNAVLSGVPVTLLPA
jgi:anaerobic selenocysteine-containing dehydrogenase